jgi:hypothetical protein
MTQTAVDFIVEQLNQSIGLTKFVDGCDEAYKNEILNIIHQAKEMFEQQMIDAIIISEKEHIIQGNVYPPQFVVDKAEQYYKKTYGGNK